jgi:excinuclease ABC subunit A
MPIEEIRVVGARHHNLKNITVTLPRNRLVVITGVSGSGKSSLAFDTLYAEGQRRYVESLSTYARQFLEQMEKPEVDRIDGLSPAVAIEQRSTSGGPRSTIATTTEIYDFMRLLFAHLGQPHHPVTGQPLQKLTVQQIVDRILALPENTPVYLFAPVISQEKGEFRDILEKLKREGFIRARIDGKIVELEHLKGLDRTRKHTIEALVDRLKVNENSQTRLTESLELALRTGESVVTIVQTKTDGTEESWTLSNQNFDPLTGFRFGELSPRHFSFNSPEGACPACHGLGTELEFDPELLVPDVQVTLAEMPIGPWRRSNPAIAAGYQRQMEALATHYEQPLNRLWKDCSETFRQAVIFGSGSTDIALPAHKKSEKPTPRPFPGVLEMLKNLYAESDSEATRQRLHHYMNRKPCARCHGARLKPEILAVTIAHPPGPAHNIRSFSQLSVTAALAWVQSLTLTAYQEKIGRDILREMEARLSFLEEVGVGYLTLDRESGTLSGGEAQRIRLATQIGSKLSGVLYILDEPSIGLHQRDNERLIKTLHQLRDLGNTVLVVEHDEDTMRVADYLLDLGPAAGARGGYVVAAGTPAEVMANPQSLTGQFLTGAQKIDVPKKRTIPAQGWLKVVGARENNLKNVTAAFPLGLMTCVTGVSGSGKSTLVNDILCRALFRHIYGSKEKPGQHERLEGLDDVDKAVVIDQSPIGRTPRSNPLTYTGAFNGIRDLFAQLPSSRVRGYAPGRFSFNVAGGRCEHCEGDGVIKIEMNFLPAVYVTCEACHGRRFNRETLEITYKGLTIADVLAMTVDDGLTFFRNIPQVSDKLEALAQVGLGYVKLGQQATTLSGGEAQRVKLASELSKKATGRTVYILDEPTTGLHFADIQQLLEVLFKLRNSGNTLIIIEHQLDIIKCADYVIDLGPEGGSGGGEIIGVGTPEEIVQNSRSYTGHFLGPLLSRFRPGDANKLPPTAVVAKKTK